MNTNVLGTEFPRMGEDMYDDVLRYLLNEWRTKFEMGSEDYGDAFKELGCKGQFSDIHRKYMKLKRSIWEGHVLRRENADECAMDIIGHCFILIWLLRNTEEGLRILGKDGV